MIKITIEKKWNCYYHDQSNWADYPVIKLPRHPEPEKEYALRFNQVSEPIERLDGKPGEKIVIGLEFIVIERVTQSSLRAMIQRCSKAYDEVLNEAIHAALAGYSAGDRHERAFIEGLMESVIDSWQKTDDEDWVGQPLLDTLSSALEA